jgi:adhesin/invasin
VQIGGTRAIPAYPITAIARPGTPKTVTLRSGQAQRGTAGSALAKPIELRIVDRFDNPVPGATVTVAPAHGSVTDSVLATDSTGIVTLRWTLGAPAGAQKLLARVAGVAKPVEVTANASVGKPSKASFAFASAVGTAGKLVAPAPSVTVTDAVGNPIAGAMVSFTVSSGTVSTAKVRTDAKGRASTKWTLGTRVGTQTLTASVAGTAARATLEAEVAKAATTATKPATSTKPAPKPALTKPAARKPPATKARSGTGTPR